MPDLDVSEVADFAASLAAAGAKVMPRVAPVVKRGALNVKKSMQKDASGHSHLPGLARTVNYETEQSALEVGFEVGFRKVGQGNLANIAAFGSVNNGPVLDVTRGLKAELPSIVEWLGRVGVEVIA